jgi:hypothetical protein
MANATTNNRVTRLTMSQAINQEDTAGWYSRLARWRCPGQEPPLDARNSLM